MGQHFIASKQTMAYGALREVVVTVTDKMAGRSSENVLAYQYYNESSTNGGGKKSYSCAD